MTDSMFERPKGLPALLTAMLALVLALAMLAGCAKKPDPADFVGTYQATSIVLDGEELDLSEDDRGIFLYLYDDGTAALFDAQGLSVNEFTWELGENGVPSLSYVDHYTTHDLEADGESYVLTLDSTVCRFDKTSSETPDSIIENPFTGAYKLVRNTTFGRSVSFASQAPAHLFLYDDGTAIFMDDTTLAYTSGSWEPQGDAGISITLGGEDRPTVVSGGDTLEMTWHPYTFVFTKESLSVNRGLSASVSLGGEADAEELVADVTSGEQPETQASGDEEQPTGGKIAGDQQMDPAALPGYYRLSGFVFGDEVVSAEGEADQWDRLFGGAYILLHEDGTAEYNFYTSKSGTWEVQGEGELLLVLDGEEYPATVEGDVITTFIEDEVTQFTKTI